MQLLGEPRQPRVVLVASQSVDQDHGPSEGTLGGPAAGGQRDPVGGPKERRRRPAISESSGPFGAGSQPPGRVRWWSRRHHCPGAYPFRGCPTPSAADRPGSDHRVPRSSAGGGRPAPQKTGWAQHSPTRPACDLMWRSSKTIAVSLGRGAHQGGVTMLRRRIVAGGMALLAGAAAALVGAGSQAANASTTSDPGVTANSITVGSISDISAPIAGLFEGAKVGTEAYFAMINSQGGVNGRKLILNGMDSAFSSGTVTNEARTSPPTTSPSSGASRCSTAPSSRPSTPARCPWSPRCSTPSVYTDPNLYSAIPLVTDGEIDGPVQVAQVQVPPGHQARRRHRLQLRRHRRHGRAHVPQPDQQPRLQVGVRP